MDSIAAAGRLRYNAGMTRYTRYAPFEEILNAVRLEIMAHAYVHAERDWSADNVCSPFNRLYFMTAGGATISNRHETVHLTRNNIYLIPCNTRYDYRCESRLEKFYLHFRLELPHGRDLFDGLDRCRRIRDANGARTKSILRLLPSRRLGDLVRIQATILDLLANCITVPVDDLRRNLAIAQKYAPFFSCLEQQQFADIPYRGIAAQLGMSLPALSRNFKRDTGATLTDYAAQQMVLKAKEKLTFTPLRIKEIAQLFGYTDNLYFSRLFKRHAGVAARDYRARNSCGLHA